MISAALQSYRKWASTHPGAESWFQRSLRRQRALASVAGVFEPGRPGEREVVPTSIRHSGVGRTRAGGVHVFMTSFSAATAV